MIKKIVISASVICALVVPAIIIFTIAFFNNNDIRRNNNALNSALRKISAETTTLDDMINLVFVKGETVVASICEHKKDLGYNIEFYTPVRKGENTPFSITKKDGLNYFLIFTLQ